jgi:xanthine dehydrogenase small subunit
MPFLMTLGASVELRRGDQSRSLPLDEFYLGYQKKALAAGEFVTAVRVPLPGRGYAVASYKVSKRFDQDISAVCGAYALKLSDGTVTDARIAYGGMAAVPQRAFRTEASLLGKPWSETTIEHASHSIVEDYTPLSDVRASSGYRLKIAGNLLKRFYHEHSGTGIPCRVTAVTAE